MREVAPFVLLVCACGAAVREPNAALPAPAPSAAAPGPSSFPPETAAALDALAARSPSLSLGMREVARRETGTDPVDLARAEGRDACVRVAFEASAPVTVTLVDQRGNVLAATAGPVSDGVLAARGPVCVRKGDVVRGLAEGAGARVRWLAWEAL